MASAGAAASLANAAYAPRGRPRVPHGKGKVDITGLDESALAEHNNMNTLTSTAAHMASRDQNDRIGGFARGTEIPPTGVDHDGLPGRDPLSVHAAYLAFRDQSPAASVTAADKPERSPTGRRVLAPDGSPGPQALRAANEALSVDRRRDDSVPPTGDLTYARTAATHSQKAAHLDKPADEEEREINWNPRTIHKVAIENAQRDIYKDRAPVNPKLDEKKRRNLLRTVSARVTEKKPVTNGDTTTTPGPVMVGGLPKIDNYGFAQASRLNTAANKLASEDLAKIYDNQIDFQGYYEGMQLNGLPRSNSKLRRRAASETDSVNIDQEHSKKIHAEMTELQRRLSHIDNQKRMQNAELEARARRNVNAAMDEIDEDLYMYTGKPSQAMLDAWEDQNLEDRKISRDVKAAGLVPIGGGRFMKQEDVDNIARSRVQPEMNEIVDYWDEERAREVEDHLDEMHHQRMENLEKERQADMEAEMARVRSMFFRNCSSYFCIRLWLLIVFFSFLF